MARCACSPSGASMALALIFSICFTRDCAAADLVPAPHLSTKLCRCASSVCCFSYAAAFCASRSARSTCPPYHAREPWKECRLCRIATTAVQLGDTPMLP